MRKMPAAARNFNVFNLREHLELAFFEMQVMLFFGEVTYF